MKYLKNVPHFLFINKWQNLMENKRDKQIQVISVSKFKQMNSGETAFAHEFD